ncbi:hypothetical protein Tco_1569902 [Tanacetum coccineum]
MIRIESGRIITKNIDDMTIEEYMEYEAEMRRDPWRYTRNSGLTTLGGTKNLENMHQPDKLKTNDYFPSIPTCFEPAQPQVSSDEDVDEWLNEELSKRMTVQDNKEEEDALIDILKTVVEESKSIYRKAQIRTPSSRTSKNSGRYLHSGAGINMMPKSLFEHFKLGNLKKTNTLLLPRLKDQTKTILLGRPFLAMIHAQIDVFRGEISLGIGRERVKFDMNGEICHSGVLLEKIYMASSIQESEYFNPHEMENNDSPALEQRTFHCSKESIDNIDSSSDSQENEVGSHLSENVSRWHVCKPVHITFKVCEEYCKIWPTCNPDLSFCSGYDVIYGKEENGMLKQWICFRDHKRQNVRGNGIKFDDFLKVSMMFKEWEDEDVNFGVNIGRTKDDPYSRNFDVYKDEFDKEIEQLVNEYELKAGRKRYAIGRKYWEECENFHDSTKLWYDEGFEEEDFRKTKLAGDRLTLPLA